jgi:hypothetical protein
MSYPRVILPELHFVGVADPGVPNAERLVFRPTQPLNLNGYGVVLGIRQEAGKVMPIFDNCFWFPGVDVVPPSWILVHTGRGEPRATQESGEQVVNFHWQRPYTVFGAPNIVPVLFRLDSAVIGQMLPSTQR